MKNLNVGKYFKISIIYFLLSMGYFVKPIITHALFAIEDALVQFVPLKCFYIYEFLKKDLSLFIPYFFRGMSYIRNLLTVLFYPLNFVYFILPFSYVFNYFPFITFLLFL